MSKARAKKGAKKRTKKAIKRAVKTPKKTAKGSTKRATKKVTKRPAKKVTKNVKKTATNKTIRKVKTARQKMRKVETEPTNVVRVRMKDIWEEANVREAGWEKRVADLQRSINMHGLLQPIGVVEQAGPKGEPFRVVFGHRRHAACKRLRWIHIDAKVAPKALSEVDLYFWQLGENNGRADLTPMEKARSFLHGIQKYSLTAKEIARREGKTVGHVSQHLALLKLPEEVQQALQEGKIKPTHAREISRVTDKDEQKKLVKAAETMRVNDFKDHISTLDKDKKKKTNRGRKAHKDATSIKRVKRNDLEIIEKMTEIDSRIDVAKQSDTEKSNNDETYYKGLRAGIIWAFGLKNG